MLLNNAFFKGYSQFITKSMDQIRINISPPTKEMVAASTQNSPREILL